MKKLKIGMPKYLNTYPLFFFLEAEESGVELVFRVPRELNRMLVNKKIHASLSSSIVYAKHFENFLVIPDISISTVGEVKSVILCHRYPLPELEGKRIAITPETESSFNLLKVLCERFLRIFPEYVFLDKNWRQLEPREKEGFAGYLAIGDEALWLNLNSQNFMITDLARLWLEFTHLPFVFALLIVRKDLNEEEIYRLKSFCCKLYLARAKGVSDLEKIVKQSNIKFPEEFAINYLMHLEYDFSGIKQRAFLKFCEYLKQLGVLERVPEINFFEI